MLTTPRRLKEGPVGMNMAYIPGLIRKGKVKQKLV